MDLRGIVRSALLIAAAAVWAVGVSGCSKTSVRPVSTYDTLLDVRDGKAYRTVKIGRQVWMAENLNYLPQTGNSWCYKNSADSCAKYGRLYDWKAAKTVCPEGYRLPSSEEWRILIAAAGGHDKAGKRLKARSGWNDYRNKRGGGTDKYGFSALPGGDSEIHCNHRDCRDAEVSFHGVGNHGSWWTSTQGGYYGFADLRSMWHDSDDMNEGLGASYMKSNGYSVRCAQTEGVYTAKVSSVGDDAVGYGGHEMGAYVYIYAGTAPRRRFKEWTSASGDITFAYANDVPGAATFTMPAHDVTATAVFDTIIVEYDTLADARDGKAYKTVKMPDGRTWMAQNLNHETPDSSWCYENSADSCEKYGRLYAWSATKNVCPAGWRLPSRAEWDTLIAAVGGVEVAYIKLSAYETDEYGFSILGSGFRHIIGDEARFLRADGNTCLWAAAGARHGGCYGYGMCSGCIGRSGLFYHDKDDEDKGAGNAYSVRCVADAP